MKKFLLIIVFAIFGLGLNAQSVYINYDDYSLAFSVTSVEPAECGLSAYSGSPTDVIIPSSVEILGTEYNITSIGGEAFYVCSSLTSIEIPSSVTSIGREAFYICSSLTSIEIPSSVTSIGREAFEACSSLTSVTFGENSQLTSIGDYAFRDCSSLTSIEIPSSVTSIGEYVFNKCTGLTSVTFRENSQLTSIGESAFEDCINLINIEMPSSVTYIGKRAFSWCDSLISVTFGENSQLTSIEDYAFYICSSLTSIEIPSSVTSIGGIAFYECSNLTSVTFGENSQLTSIGEYVFSSCSSLTSIEIPSSVTSIGRYAFYECSGLTSVTFRENSHLTYIGERAFEDCIDLISIEMPSSVTYIGEYVFNECTGLTSVTFGENSQLISIVRSAFEYCLSLTSIEIPSSVTYIGERTFYECSGLKAIKCYAENIPKTGTDVFEGCPSDMIIYVPEVSLEEYKATSPWNNFTIYPLEDPQNVTATVELVSIILTWDNCHADSYNIYRDGDSIANVVDTLYLDKNLNCLTRYCYKITAVRNETETDKSEEVCATTFDLPITTPKNLVAEATSDSSILLTWNEVENALSYNIYRDGDLLTNVTTATYTDNDLEYNTEYCYTVTSVRNEQESENSNSDCATTFDLPITTPENLVATPTSTSSIELTWNEVENALSYNIYRDGDSIANVTTATYTDNDLEYDTEYCYIVTAVRNETETEKSEEVCVLTFDLPITTPENLVAEATSDSSIVLTWNDVENALSYNIYRDGDSIANVTETSYSDENLDSDSTYCYEVAAVRNETETEKSEEDCATTLKSDDGNDDGNDDGTESIEELSSSFKIYPNPVQNELFLATELRVEEVSIYDIYGRQQAVSYQPSAVSSIDVADLEAGVYFINIKTENGNVVKRFIKN